MWSLNCQSIFWFIWKKTNVFVCFTRTLLCKWCQYLFYAEGQHCVTLQNEEKSFILQLLIIFFFNSDGGKKKSKASKKLSKLIYPSLFIYCNFSHSAIKSIQKSTIDISKINDYRSSSIVHAFGVIYLDSTYRAFTIARVINFIFVKRVSVFPQ